MNNKQRSNSVTNLTKGIDPDNHIAPAKESMPKESKSPEITENSKPRMHFDKVFESNTMKDGYMKIEYEEVLHLDPKDIIVPENRDRFSLEITAESCQELISTIQANGQLIPGIVRRIDGEKGAGKLELVVGARRRFCCEYLNIPFTARVKVMTDFEVKMAQDIENASRKDISQYERGRFYARWLAEDFNNNVSRMAESVKSCKRVQLSRLIRFGQIPDVIRAKIINITSENERDYRELRPLILDKEDNLLPEITEKLQGIPDASMTQKELTLFLKDSLKKPQTQKRKPIKFKNPSGSHSFKISFDDKNATASINLPEDILRQDEESYLKAMRLIWMNVNS